MRLFLAILAAGLVLLWIYFSDRDARERKKEDRERREALEQIERMLH